ncbi:aldo/keto reductase [Amycolatopsis cihanbeyliensis]|uniref:Aryl-alcohol dehydrogenase-like predicted oxidoreductase n=1 Tax=Amycolatopsis cihanbeyliensis TaxID=1128664 RepID=A0A542DCD6_AMYCI|nr:aldo/keto reductase [Amycolatopsis cihanbeyliensis]TQJ00734.1 aryl-alcohol dehydrogenase-like predicted oxidoreductase [Amycolatopsis cihanbeyliensis]
MVTAIGLGLAAVGRPAYINLGRVAELPASRSVTALRAVTHALLDQAYAAGIRHIDVARSYGRAEEFLGAWLAERGHQDLVISSKWGYAYVGDWRLDAPVHEAKEHSADRFLAQWRESRSLLGDAISLYQVHSLTSDSPLFTDRRLLEELAALAGSGVRLGFSTSGPRQPETIRRAFELEVSGVRLFTAVQSTWNLLEPSAGAALAEARAAGAWVLVKETLANGRLAVDPPGPVAELATARGDTPDAVALAAALSQPWADVVLTGPASGAQLAGNLAAEAITLADAERDRLAALAEVPEEYWARRAALAWQ